MNEITGHYTAITEISPVLAFIVTMFILYRIFIKTKDATIERLKTDIASLERKIDELKSQTPDIIVDRLAKRIEITKNEIVRLKEDAEEKQNEITEKEEQLCNLHIQLSKLNKLIEGSDLVCPICKAPLIIRDYHTIFGHCGGHEVEADIEYVEYECGLSLADGKEASPCRSSGAPDFLEGQKGRNT